VPDAPELLKQDHRTVEGLFERCKSGDREVVKQICHELTIHTALEEEHLYPLLRQVDGGEELRQEAEKDHQELKDAIKKGEQAGSDSEIEQAMQAIIDGVTHHVQEEENEVLPKLVRELGQQRVEWLGQQLGDANRSEQVSERAQVSEQASDADLDDLSNSSVRWRRPPKSTDRPIWPRTSSGKPCVPKFRRSR
jgi:hemerythrin superfamily protein